MEHPLMLQTKKAIKTAHAKVVPAIKKIQTTQSYTQAETWIKNRIGKYTIGIDKQKTRTGFLVLGIIVSIWLLYAIISSLFSSQLAGVVPEVYKDKLLQAQTAIEDASRNMGNQDVFNADMDKATNLILAVQAQKLFLSDTQKLLANISALRKQVSGVESFTLSSTNLMYSFQNAKSTFGLVAILQINKQWYFVGQNSITGPYIAGSGPAKTYPYPDGEEAVSADTNENGIEILTKSNRMLNFNKGQINYQTVEMQQTWEPSSVIHTYNSNVYLLSNGSGNTAQIFKHRPGVSGFASKNGIIPQADTKGLGLLDFAVDGGFYLLKNDLTIDRVMTAPQYSKNSVILNKLPKEDYKQTLPMSPKLFVGNNLSYVYLLLDGDIWIFQPDSKSFKDVRSLTYIGRLNAANSTLKTIAVPTDGTILVGDANGVYTVQFEINNGKIIIRS